MTHIVSSKVSRSIFKELIFNNFNVNYKGTILQINEVVILENGEVYMIEDCKDHQALKPLYIGYDGKIYVSAYPVNQLVLIDNDIELFNLYQSNPIISVYKLDGSSVDYDKAS